MDEIECLVCDKTIKLPAYVGPKYDGQIKCTACKSILAFKMGQQGEVQKYKIIENKPKSFSYLKLMELAEKEERRQKEKREG